MKKKTKNTIPIPDEYFDKQMFLVDESKINEDEIPYNLGDDPSPERILRYELCSCISEYLISEGLSLSQASALFDLNRSDISRIRNYQIYRFTIDRLISIYTKMDASNVSTALNRAAKKIKKLTA